jgi:Family of unknown function (DUF5947)
VSRPSGLRRFVGPPGPAPTRDAPPAAPPAQAFPDPQALPDPQVLPDPVQAALGTGPAPRDDAEEHCEFCATGIPAEHGHVADLEQSSLACACRACYLLFTARQAGRGRYKSVPDRYLRDSSRPMSALEWDELQIPVGLAFFLNSSERGLGGFYPSPAGATECTLDLAAWERLASAYPLLGAAEPDVEAVLLCRDSHASQAEYFIVPIDVCYELAGRMRMLWKGFDGGSEARASIEEFLAGVRTRARERSASPGGRPPGPPRESPARGDPPSAGPTSPASQHGPRHG